MSADQRKVAVLKTLLERVQQRAAAPRAAVRVAAVAMAASASVEAAHPVDDEPTPLISASALSGPVPEALPVAEELTPSDEIMIVELSPSPGPTEVAELEVVEDELASEAARIEEALSSDADDEPPTSSSERPQPHRLEAMMAPIELDPISDRPTARITLPPEADASDVVVELPPQAVPAIEDEPTSSGPEITISSEPAEITLIPDEDELIEIVEPLSELEASPPASQVQPPALPELPRDLATLDLDEPGVEEAELELEEVIELEPEAELAPVSAEVPVAAAEAVRAVEPAESVQAEPATAEEALVATQAERVSTPAEPVGSKEEPRNLVAELVQRPAREEAEVAAVVGKVEAFAPTTFGELLDASLEL